MNIFVTSCNPYLAAAHLDDLRLNKMILETAQLLSTAIRVNAPNFSSKHDSVLYKKTHENHPCSIWTRKKNENFNWLFKYFMALHGEYQIRKETGKSHLSYEKLIHIFLEYMNHIQQLYSVETDNNKIIFDFDCTNVDSQTLFLDEGIHGKYKECMIRKWINDKRAPTWKNSHVPDFARFFIMK